MSELGDNVNVSIRVEPNELRKAIDKIKESKA